MRPGELKGQTFTENARDSGHAFELGFSSTATDDGINQEQSGEDV